jgi:hypothetical protein
MTIIVSTSCPFCGGTAPLLESERGEQDVILIERFRGLRVSCAHGGCEKAYAIRRGDLRIRREGPEPSSAVG